MPSHLIPPAPSGDDREGSIADLILVSRLGFSCSTAGIEPQLSRSTAPSGGGIIEPALSFSGQPNLRSLVEAVTALEPARLPVTIVCGAGVSIDSGLPTWGTLVDRMCDGVQGVAIADVVRSDPIDSLRKVDYIVRLRDPRRGLADMVQDALYKEMKDAGPGPLASAIAQFVASLKGRVRVLTTNFDRQIERALADYFVEEGAVRSAGPFKLKTSSTTEYDVDLSAFDGSIDVEGEVSVLHLHGMVSPSAPVIEPLILSESYFLRFGAYVKKIVREYIQTSSLTLFVGVSLADPNIVGPLNDLEAVRAADPSAVPPVFLLTSPDEIEGQSFGRVQAYTESKCGYYERQFGVKPILLKSYAQVTQTIFELSVALADCEAYCGEVPPETSTRYGFRLERALDDAYRCLSPSGEWDMNVSQRISDGLARALATIEGRLVHHREYLAEHQLEESGLDREILRKERFALFLWMRVRSADRPHKDGPVPYAIRLVGSSAYSYREGWLTPTLVPIEPGQTFAAARAAFMGTTQLSAITRPSPWRTNLSVPIVFPFDHPDGGEADSEGGGAEDALRGPVTVGVVSLDSTHFIPAHQPDEPVPLSILAGLDDLEFEQLAKSVLEAVQAECLATDGAAGDE
jgi:hypothetical protein